MKDDPLEGVNPEVLGKPIRLQIAGYEALYLLSIIQVATRHPKFKEHNDVNAFAMSFGHALQHELVSRIPQLEEICAKGWDPEEDV